MTKLKVTVPPPATIRDLASDNAKIKKIWDEADRESREDAAELRARRYRAERSPAAS